MVQGALVLEGGALRGMFTAGVLDVLLEKGIEFSYVNGVSAGSLNGMNYISKQRERSKDINLQFVNDKRYLGARNIVSNGAFLIFIFCLERFRNNYIRLMQESFFYRSSGLKLWRQIAARGKQNILKREKRRRLSKLPPRPAVCRFYLR